MQKVDEIGCVINNNNVHIACITESWLNESVMTDTVNIPGYVCYRRDRVDGRRGGGVVCYVRDDVPCQRIAEFECNDVECLWLLFRGSRMPRLVSHILIGTIYYPPNGDSMQTVSHIMDCLDKITHKHPHVGIILCGDFNQLKDSAILCFPLKQIVNSATRRSNILDKIYTNIKNYYNTPCILPPIGKSDHNAVLVQALKMFNFNGSGNNIDYIMVRSHNPNSKSLLGLANVLSTFNWSSLYKMDDCNEMLDYFYYIICDLLNEYFSVRVSRRHETEKP